MATENKRINTRLMLKYDTYANWTTNNPVLLKGEVAIATISAESATQPTKFQNIPNVVMKVGDGSSHYNDLKFVSGLAADVYEWAKAADKPSYAISEIDGAKEYTVVKGASDYEWKLQAKAAGSNDEYTDVATINLSAISTRIKAVEDDVADHETRLAAAEGTIGDSSKGLVKDVADLKALMGEEGEGSVSDKINDAITGLNATKTQTAGADGLALEVVQKNGVIESISGSIAANTYDAYGSASAVLGTSEDAATANTVYGVKAAAAAAQKAADDAQADIDQEVKDRQAAITALKMEAAVEGAQEGTVVKFIDKVYQENGIVSAELGELVFNSAYNAESNKAATMSDVRGAVADLNGAMHFEGFTSTDPATGITIEGKPDYVAAAGDVVIYNTVEYVYDGSKWQKLGEEGALGAALEALASSKNVAADETVKTVVQSNGAVTVESQKIQIVEGQVTGLTDKLAAMQKEIDDEETRAANAESGLQAAIDKIEGTDEGKSMREVAQAVATNSLEAISDDSIIAPTPAQTISLIKQTNGVVEATAQEIQIAESQVTGLTAALAAKATEADLTLAENRIKANEDALKVLNGAVTESGSVAHSIDAKIQTLNKEDTAVAGQFVTAVSEENGIITVSRGAVNVKDLEQTANTYVVFDCGSSSVNI